MQSADPVAPRRKGMGPILLSALVYPGLGQLVQGRRLAGAIYGASFTVAAGWFAVNAARILVVYYRFATDLGGTEDPVVSYAQILIPFGIASILYLINLVDIVIPGRGR